MQKYQDDVKDPAGNGISGASVTVYTYPAGVLATLYDDDSVTTIANPVTTDSVGRYFFRAVNGAYSLTVSATNIVTYSKTDVILFDPADGTASADLSYMPAGTGAVETTVEAKLRESVSVADFGDPSASEAAATAAFNLAVTAIGSNGCVVNPEDSLLNFEAVTVPNAVMVIDMAGQKIVTSIVGVGKSVQAGGGHLLIRDVRDNMATRTHIEPNGYVAGVASKLDMMHDPYEDEGTSYRILNFYTKNYDVSDTSTTQGNNGVSVIGVKGTGFNFGVWPTLHFGFSDDGASGAVPMKMYYFDTSDTTWRTPMKGAWRTGVSITTGDYNLSNNKLYQASTTGTTGATAPSHAAGSASDGGVTWAFVRDFAAASGSVRGTIVFGDRDDLPKFGHIDTRVQYAKNAFFWNGVKLQFGKSDNTAEWEILNFALTDDLYIRSADTLRALRLDATGQFIQTIGMGTVSTAVSAADADTTPSIKGAGTLIFGNTGATNVTQFDDGVALQHFYVQSGNSNTTLVHGANLKLAGAVNKTMTVDDVLLFQMNTGGTVAKQVI